MYIGYSSKREKRKYNYYSFQKILDESNLK